MFIWAASLHGGRSGDSLQAQPQAEGEQTCEWAYKSRPTLLRSPQLCSVLALLSSPERQRQSRSRSASSLPSPPAATRAPPPPLFSSRRRRRRRGWRPPTSSGPTRSMPGRSSTPLPSPTPWSTSAPSSLVMPPTLFSLRLCRCFCLVDHVPAATLRHLLTASPYAVAIIFSLLVLEH